MPESWGLGVHLTLDLEGRARFGPDVEWIDNVEYNTNPELCDKFYPVIRQYWPGLPDGSLRPSYSGIRPKVLTCCNNMVYVSTHCVLPLYVLGCCKQASTAKCQQLEPLHCAKHTSPRTCGIRAAQEVH